MTRIAIFVAVLLSGGVAAAEDRVAIRFDDADRKEIAQVILGQMAAFKAGNGDAAFALAAPAVRERFGSPETFMRTVKEEYEPVYNPRSVRFGPLGVSRMGPVQHVFVLDPKAVAFVALYIMELSDDGRWQIAGCILRPRRSLET